MDGRVFLNQAGSVYDAIFMDAFSSLTPPYQLTTVEALRHGQRLLERDGAVITNVVAHGEEDDYLSAVMTTYRAVFKYVDIYQVANEPLAERQNLIVVATNSSATRSSVASSLDRSIVDISSTRLLTDDHAPVEQLINSR